MDVLKTYTFKDFTFLICFCFVFFSLRSPSKISATMENMGLHKSVWSECDSHKPPELQMLPYIRILLIYQQKHHECICQSNQIVHQHTRKLYQLMSKTKQTLANRPAFVFYLMGSFSHWLNQKLLGANAVVFLNKGAHCWSLGNKATFFASWGE